MRSKARAEPEFGKLLFLGLILRLCYGFVVFFLKIPTSEFLNLSAVTGSVHFLASRNEKNTVTLPDEPTICRTLEWGLFRQKATVSILLGHHRKIRVYSLSIEPPIGERRNNLIPYSRGKREVSTPDTKGIAPWSEQEATPLTIER